MNFSTKLIDRTFTVDVSRATEQSRLLVIPNNGKTFLLRIWDGLDGLWVDYHSAPLFPYASSQRMKNAHG